MTKPSDKQVGQVAKALCRQSDKLLGNIVDTPAIDRYNAGNTHYWDELAKTAIKKVAAFHDGPQKLTLVDKILLLRAAIHVMLIDGGAGHLSRFARQMGENAMREYDAN